jgi:two-component system, OmpR family, sensor histidine kinase MprB
VSVGDVVDEPREEFDLAALATEVAARYERRSGRDIVVVAEPSCVVAQRGAVQRALSCLLDNATKFDPSGAAIDVTVREGGIAVADRGMGIPERELGLVFERFHRSDEARTMPGSGLGLSIVRDVAERHGGSVFARNRDGGGAVVGFRLGA